jgi:hypothetical protein
MKIIILGQDVEWHKFEPIWANFRPKKKLALNLFPQEDAWDGKKNRLTLLSL